MELKGFIKKICKDQSRNLVGKACKQIEVLQAQPDISEESKKILGLQKALLKELIYEHFRDTSNAISFYLEGREYKSYQIYSPKKES